MSCSSEADNHVIRAPIDEGRITDEGDLAVELTVRSAALTVEIRPISIAGGAVKVKDELRIEFDIVTVSR